MPRVFELSVDAALENLGEIRSFIRQAGAALGVRDDALGDLCLVVDEAVTNVILHGYQGAGGPVDIHVQRDGDAVVILLRDRGGLPGARHRHLDPGALQAALVTRLRERARRSGGAVKAAPDLKSHLASCMEHFRHDVFAQLLARFTDFKKRSAAHLDHATVAAELSREFERLVRLRQERKAAREEGRNE